MRLFIVESPAKCQKIRSYLGDGWKVIASMGHVRGLEESLDAVGIESGWNPRFEILKGKTKAVKEIKDAAKGATEVWLGTDDDREGEAIAWHLCHLLKLSPENTPRAIFHEVTETAIQASVADKNKRLNGPMVQAQLARSMLDLLVGYSISPVLWKNIAYGLSAGRCQTPALHLVYDKEMEIAGFASKQSWVYEANFTPVGFDFPIACVGLWTPTSLTEVREYMTPIYPIKGGSMLVDSTDKTMNQSPPMPLITSSLQQECSSVYHINPKTTMMIAQQLYEAGHITYMRTDNPVLGVDCLAECREFIEGKYGENYLGSGGSAGGKKPKKKKAEKEAVVQGAHEAIHPTHMDLTSLPTEETWTDQHRKVYSHIWRRTLQSVMAAAQQKSRALVFQIDDDETEPEKKWKGSLSMLTFKGWKILNEENDTEKEEQFVKTNVLTVGTKAKWSDMVGRQIATQPPSRFSEAQLVQQLEEKGIGRPSTFASLIATILDRKYVEKKTSKGIPVDLYKLERAGPKGDVKQSIVKKDVGGDKDKIHLTSLGKSVIDFVDTRFSDIFGYGFTAGMEEDLDLVAHGKKDRVAILDGLWSTMKDRVGTSSTEGTAGGGGNTKSLKEFTLEGGITISIANTKKGVLLIKKTPGIEKAEFAAMPPTADAATMTQEDAEALFAAKEGDSLGFLDEMPVLLKKGQYGQYVEWNGVRQSYKEGTEFEALCDQLKNKTGATQSTDSSLATFIRQVGDYTIKRGPYGLFFYRGGAAKMIFAKFPAALAAETISAADCAAAYKLASEEKAKGGRGGRGRGRGRGRGH